MKTSAFAHAVLAALYPIPSHTPLHAARPGS